MIESESPTTATAKPPLERIPPIGRKIIIAMMFVGLAGFVLTSSGTPAHQASLLLVMGGWIVPMGLVVVHPNLPKWEWMSQPIERLAIIWLTRFGFVIFLYAFATKAVQLANTLLAS